jgi:hypothetical protein
MTWRRMVRRVIAWSVGPPLIIVAAALGTVVALLYTPPGLALTARVVTSVISDNVAGRVSIGRIRGGLVGHVVLEDVSIHDSTGALVVAVPRLEARYLLTDLIGGRIIISELDAQRPVMHLVRLRRGRWNYQEVFRSGNDTTPGGAPPRVELRDVAIHGGTLRLYAPTDGGPPKQPISRNGAEPAQPERLETSDGLVQVYRATEMNGRFPLIRISTPREEPILVQIAAFNARLAYPDIQIVNAVGEIVTKSDSLRFRFDHAELPGTRLSGSGAVRWPQDTLRYDFALQADTVALRDLRWIQPDFPDWEGRGNVVALSTTNRHSEFLLEEMVLGDSGTRAAGRLVAIVDDDRGFGVRDLDMVMSNVSLEVMRPYLDTLPFRGTLTGRLQADGYKTLMELAGDLDFVDAVPVGAPINSFDFAGNVALGGNEGAVFQAFTLREALVEMATVRAMVPAIALPGRMRLVGRLDGPWQNVTFQGTAEHVAPNDALSRMTGTVRLDTRGALLAIGMDAQFDRLSFDGLRTGYPDLTPVGGLTGRVIANGRLDSLVIDADVTGEVGDIVARGLIGATPPRYTFDGLFLDVHRLDAQALLGRGENTALNGTMLVTGVIDSGAPPIGTAELNLGQSRIGGLTLSGLIGTAHSDGRLITLDTMRAAWDGGSLLANGTLGWTARDSGALQVVADNFSLAPFDSLARATLQFDIDTTTYRPLTGTGRANLSVFGSIEDLAIDGVVEADSVVFDDWSLGSLTAQVRADSLSTTGLRLTAQVDTLRKARQVATGVELAMEGTADSMTFAASGSMRQSRLALGGWRVKGAELDRVGLDSLSLDLSRQRWLLAAPAVATVGNQLITLLDTVRVVTEDGSGMITLTGNVPGLGTGELEASIVGLELSDIYALLGRDTTQMAGLAQADFRLGGTRTSPTLRGNAMVTGPVFGEATPPLLRATYDYVDQMLRSNITFWKLGEPVLEVDASLPFDLALASRQRRRLPGPIEIRATADSAELSLIEAFTPSIRSTTGTMSLDLGVTGTWEAPRLEGFFAVNEGRTTIPVLGVRYGPIQGRAAFVGDSMVIEDRITLASDEGELAIDGSIRFESLTRTALNLELTSRRFLAINDPGFMVVRPSGTVQLTGSLTRPVMSGNTVSITESDIYFADLLAKNIINLEDPIYRRYVDLDRLRRNRLGASFQSRFLDSLRINNLRVVVGPDVWLRSADAEIQLEGEAQVSKIGPNYIVAGELDTPRGEYTLNLAGVVKKKFTIDRGTVRYVGTSDLDAELNIQASHRVRALDGSEIPVQATITGTILVPRVTLSSPGRTDLPERDLIAYLVFGRSEAQLAGSSARSTGTGLAAQNVITLLASELERSVVQETGSGLDLFEIRPGIGPGDPALSSYWRVAVGAQIGTNWFITATAGVCQAGDRQGISARNFGASIDYRVSRDWKVQLSAEPVQSCSQLSEFSNIARRYQLGGDILWEREY